jgi:Na+-translocating ferredoxin:NAD+ oxidoreductase RnfC subunit
MRKSSSVWHESVGGVCTACSACLYFCFGDLLPKNEAEPGED